MLSEAEPIFFVLPLFMLHDVSASYPDLFPTVKGFLTESCEKRTYTTVFLGKKNQIGPEDFMRANWIFSYGLDFVFPRQQTFLAYLYSGVTSPQLASYADISLGLSRNLPPHVRGGGRLPKECLRRRLPRNMSSLF